ncbi:TPR-containing nuclear phosphoprotein that regulates K() uptake [Plasmopara halstedii]|uniref:TPR-containing nuclear phosphoprotein that regulates K( ) uptake n=1 Tax=Plasmopara halstedii TaxID=4781 RepID=A0A0P1B4U7_PLAHL|nr:TPR-containing nuclear phosphoprotein that regulates K() uptake [Plasmopara halstedii]CEG49164.1 TPR-containing nuclear phosphoprotein that regulates K() uptake [Plasmopara halstedii]|eukprot:XP_024585533.1 TPR-containing nuclear phosphoprotein that regulates K() uptake [Plasmopara halstedii]
MSDEELSNHRALLIPVKNSEQAVEVFVDELPDDVNDIIDILRAEVAPLDVWLQFAVEYYNQGHVAQFQEILAVASEPGIEEIYKDNASRVCRIKFFIALASHAVNAMWNEEDDKKREAISQRAVGFFQRADRLDHQHPMTLVGKALMFMAKNEDDRADRFIKSVLISNKTNLPAILGKALLLYRKKQYKDAKKLYLEAIKLHPRSPQAANMRMCFAYCCYHLGAIEKARAVMRYTASLDETNVDARIASALWQLASQSREERAVSIRDESSRFMMMIHHAHAIDKTNPTVLNHLANHYFSQWIPLPCTVSVVRGSAFVATSKDISSEVSPGQIICIGDKYVAYISRQEDAVSSSGLKLDGPYRDESATATNIARKDYDKMFTLAGNAFHSTKIAEIRSESCYLMGRGCHAQGKYKDAYSYYFNAGRLWPKFVLPWFGLAQIYYERKEFTKAASYLEKANKAYPENVEILSLLGDVYGKLGKKDEAVVLLRRVVELEPGNVEALIGTAELLHASPERKDRIIAISSYIAAEKVMNNASERVCMELYVNLGVLQQRVGKCADAIKCFRKALQQLGDIDNWNEESKSEKADALNEDVSNFKPTEANVTILYNMGRVYEEMGNRDCAQILYNAILVVFPKYTDCLLRLGCMLRDRGQDDEAIRMFDKKKYEKVMGMPGLKNDPYAFLSMGNIFMSNLGEKNRYAKNMSLSEVYYKKTLAAHPRNIYAANGLGIMIAEKGNFELAKQVFSQVREASPDMPDAWINLAHIFVAEERYQEAIQLYTVCLTKCYQGQDLEVLLYLAKAYYESKNFPSCIATLSRGLHMYPNDLQLWYNTGLAQEDYAVMTLGQETTVARSGGGNSVPQHRTMADVQRAILDLKRAQRIFRFLLQQAEASGNLSSGEKKKHHNNLPFDKEKVSDHEKFCGDTLTKASYHLEFERQKEEKRRLEIEAQRKLLREYEERVARELEEARVQEEDLRKRHEGIRLKQDERLKKLHEGWSVREREEEEKKVVKKRGGKKRKKAENEDGGFIDDGEDELDEDEDTSMSIEDMKNRNPTMKKLVEKRIKRARANSGSDDDKVDPTGLFGSDSSDDEQDKPSTDKNDDKVVTQDQSREVEKNELFGSSSDEE